MGVYDLEVEFNIKNHVVCYGVPYMSKHQISTIMFHVGSSMFDVHLFHLL